MDSTILLEDEFIFEPSDNITTDGRYLPKAYRLTFSTDIAYSPTVAASTYGAYALTQFMISDLLGYHQLSTNQFQIYVIVTIHTIWIFKEPTNWLPRIFIP